MGLRGINGQLRACDGIGLVAWDKSSWLSKRTRGSIIGF